MPSFGVLQDQQMSRPEIISLLPKEVKEKCWYTVSSKKVEVFRKISKWPVALMQSVTYDIAFGGMFYVIIDADKHGLEISVSCWSV